MLLNHYSSMFNIIINIMLKFHYSFDVIYDPYICLISNHPLSLYVYTHRGIYNITKMIYNYIYIIPNYIQYIVIYNAFICTCKYLCTFLHIFIYISVHTFIDRVFTHTQYFYLYILTILLSIHIYTVHTVCIYLYMYTY